MTSPSNLQLEQVAKKIINSGMFFIPLLPNEKKNWDTDFLTKDYSEKDWKQYVKINQKNYNREIVYSCDDFDIVISTSVFEHSEFFNNH